ncbi:hypothetical protein [Gordonia alkaliphila]|uniref:tRNA nuclease CdiA C-terminal domain-containing protein n=1 Tax=Gordonia alkaliphila TaxID=1053547 RepID=A0ABP8ZGS4_9ACTN
MPILLPNLARLTDIVAGKGARAAGLAFVNSAKVGGTAERKVALATVLPGALAPVAGAMSAGHRQWYLRQPGGVDGFDAELLPPADRELAAERVKVLAGWALTQSDSRAAFEGGVDRWLRNVGRETVLHNAEAEGARWYRYASANACGFCRMLATRGAVYVTARTAGEGNRYHDHCHCLAVVVRPGDTYTPSPQVQQWQKDYEAARDAGLTKPGEIATFMDNAPTGKATRARQAREAAKADPLAGKRRAPATAGGNGDDGGRKPPHTGGPAGLGPEPDPGDKNAHRAYWKARQDALPVDFRGDVLGPHEVKFVETFLDADHTLDWIPRDPKRRPTNDFVWTSNGDVEIELKSTKARYETIHGTIVKASSRAAKHDVVKDRFIIDLVDQPLTDDLRSQLEGFNVGRKKYRLRGLWVMTQGQLHEINLAY